MTGQIQPDDDQEAFYSVQTCQVVGSAETFAAAFLNSTDLSLERIWQTKSHLFDGIQILSLDVVKGETDGEVKVHIVEDGKLGRDVWTLKDVFNAHFVDQVAASHATRVRLTWEIRRGASSRPTAIIVIIIVILLIVVQQVIQLVLNQYV
ncbi:Aste57867_7375 [Aphanomyces stellatus]|nr:hypothetical protein As57867_007349 [Aphanomyces stellatus]KAF0704453.1 hypothetical protein As57867_007324 [Aphanomyces stellatus]KAF0715143.1 hypothetical protein As57867_003548 [Aphanomyces stellatus]VFT80722.1 Aste57867_3559 [Aphanomyces stellatus]VFT84267.1 Aste57867_7350 [Aphanomyces stellatus]